MRRLCHFYVAKMNGLDGSSDDMTIALRAALPVGQASITEIFLDNEHSGSNSDDDN